MSTFERYLTVWVALCIMAGIGLGYVFPSFSQAIGSAEIANVNLPVAVLIACPLSSTQVSSFGHLELGSALIAAELSSVRAVSERSCAALRCTAHMRCAHTAQSQTDRERNGNTRRRP